MTQPPNQRIARPRKGRKSSSPVSPQNGQPPAMPERDGQQAASPSATSSINHQQTGQQVGAQQNEQQPIAQQPTPPQSQGQASPQHQRRQWWDWLDLFSKLAIPLVVVGVTIGFGWWQGQLANMQHQSDQQIVTDQQRETTLQSYLDRMSDLQFNQHLDKSQPGDEVRNAAQARTLTALRQLDSKRKGLLLQFLYKAGLISRDNTIINLDGADLSDADLQGLDLHGVNLQGANLQGANLSGALLYDSILVNATLSDANLSGVDLNGALLIGAHLSGADLSRDNLQKKATLENANLFGAELNGANLSWADLSGAYLLYSLQLHLFGENLPEGAFGEELFSL